MKKYVTVLLVALLLAVSSAGCAPELYERALISAVGVDETEAGCRVTVRAALPADDGQEISLSGEGRTVPEALNEIARTTGQQPLYSHNTLVVFGMDCAKSGLAAYLDFFIRHYDSRPTVKVFLSETTAEDILRVDVEDEAPRAAEIAELTKGAVYSGLSADVNLIGLINGTYGEGASAVVPVLRRSDSIEPAGTALLRGLTLQGALSPAAVQGLLLLQGALEAGQFAVSDPECGAVTLTVSASDCRVRFTGTEESPRFAVSVQIEGEISAISVGKHQIENDAFPRLERAFAEQAVAAVEAYLSGSVYESGCDAAGFGGAVLRDAPEVWRRVSENWPALLPNAVFDVEAQASIERVEEEDTPYL